GAGQPQAGAAADAADGAEGDLPQAEAEYGRPGASDLPVSAAGRVHREARPGLEHGNSLVANDKNGYARRAHPSGWRSESRPRPLGPRPGRSAVPLTAAAVRTWQPRGRPRHAGRSPRRRTPAR